MKVTRKAFLIGLTVVCTTSAASSAWALKQKDHESIVNDICPAYGFEDDFCERVADAAYNTDAFEFGYAPAHSHPEDGQSHCDGARAVQQRLLELGSELREETFALSSNPSSEQAETVADLLGRAMHTIHDLCAHQGLQAKEHAWYTVNDTCLGTSTSPDIIPANLSCARDLTELAFGSFASLANESGVDVSDLERAGGQMHRFPPRAKACEFLNSVYDWDGRPTLWDQTIVNPHMLTQWDVALTQDDAQSIGDICASGPDAIELANPRADVDVSGGPNWCAKLDAYCAFTKADDETPAEPPWESDETAASPAAESEGTGCSMSSSPTSPWSALVALLGLSMMGWVRRSRRH